MFFFLLAGADPKSVVCAFFKQGLCGKGDKCKFSHDLALDRKGEKRSIYVDSRDTDDNLKNGIATYSEALFTSSVYGVCMFVPALCKQPHTLNKYEFLP